MNKTQKPSAKPEAIAVPPKKKSTRGRKSTVTEVAAAKFILALENGFAHKECLVEAGISQDAYERRLKASAEFRGQVEIAKMKLTMVARSKLALAISEGDKPTIRWYLERKVPEEFRTVPGDEGSGNPLPEGTIIILPGSKPHPRIIPEGQTK